MNARIHNRSSQAGKDGWYQIEVSGEHPAGRHEDGRARTQVIDEDARKAIVNRFRQEREEGGENWPGMLVDADHLSHDLSQRTEAFAWLQDVEERGGELWGRLDVTDLGEGAVKNRRYKFFTTEYDPGDLEDLGDGRVRPHRLAGLAFTNRPNNRGGRPISNRAGEVPEADNHETTEPNTMKAVAEKLGLSADASEADVLKKIDDLMAQAAEGEAEAVMNRYAARIPDADRDEVKKELIKNRADGLEKILSYPAPAEKKEKPPERIHNRAGATAPEPVEGRENAEDGGDDRAGRKAAAGIRNRATELQSANPRLSYSQAFRQAQAELSD